MNQIAEEKAPLPPELGKKFNWGAFFLNWVWGAFHKYYWPLLVMVCIAAISAFVYGVMVFSLESGTDAAILDVSKYIITTIILTAIVPAVLILGYQIYLGKNGNKIAWERREWRDVEHFKSVQKKWGIVGLVFFVLAMAVNLLVALLFIVGGDYISLEKNPDAVTSEVYSEQDNLSEKEKSWLVDEYKKFRSVVDSENGNAIVSYLVNSASSLIGQEGFAESEEVYRYYNNSIFLTEERHLNQDWKGGMPTFDEFTSMVDDSIVVRYGTYFGSGEKNEIIYFETPQIEGKDFSWVLLFVVVPDEERVVFMTDK